MPVISTFYGIIVYLYAWDTMKHNRPHVHIRYGEFRAGIAIDDGDILFGSLPRSKMKLIQAWIEIHKQELLEDWQLAINGQKPFKISPLK
jgi:hypothetical protein